MSFQNPSSSLLILPIHSTGFTFFSMLTSLPPWLVMSQGTSDSSSGGRGELPGQAGAGHSQTAERGGQCSAGASHEHHRTAAAAAAATSGKEGHRVPSWQDAVVITAHRLILRSCPVCDGSRATHTGTFPPPSVCDAPCQKSSRLSIFTIIWCTDSWAGKSAVFTGDPMCHVFFCLPLRAGSYHLATNSKRWLRRTFLT